MNPGNALEVNALTKSYKGGFTLGPLSFTLPSGCILGLIGENGAGKTTAISLLLNMLRKDGGSAQVLGMDSERDSLTVREKTGAVIGQPGLPWNLNAVQVGKVMGGIFRNWDGRGYAALLQKLRVPVKQPYFTLSAGTKMKLGIAIAMSHGAKLLLLDEPTAGLDPVARDEVLQMLEDFTRDENHAILISSHITSDLEKLCDYIAFLHRGKLLLCEEKDRLLEKYGVLRCTAEEFAALPSTAVVHHGESPYGVEALVLREFIPDGRQIGAVSLEDLFIHCIQGGNET